jgi:hypothetical protein
MRKQSSAIRVAYNMLRNQHAQIYHGLRQLFPELPTKYIDSAIYKAKQYPTDKPVVFGGKRLFEKLCKNHLSGKVRERLKKQWKEQRQGTLVSIGSKSDKGNRLTRFENLNRQLHLREQFCSWRVCSKRMPNAIKVSKTSAGIRIRFTGFISGFFLKLQTEIQRFQHAFALP